MSAPTGPPSWAATQRGPNKYNAHDGSDNISGGDAYDRIGLSASQTLGRISSSTGGEHPQQQQQQQQPWPSEHGQQNFSPTQRNSTFQPLTRPQAEDAEPDRHRRTQSLRPFSAYQPLEQPGTPNANVNAASSSPAMNSPRRPASPAGSTTQSIRSAVAPLTFKSPELKSALSLQDAQQRKIYMEGYLSRRDALGTDGRPLRPHDPKRSWHLCFVQLSGTVLSVWSVREMEQAAREGREVPPSYVNVTDSFVDLIGNLIEDPAEVPGSRGRYENVFALNSAGNNRILFCVEGTVGRRLVQAWINGIRLASWEKVRLEEIYTGALIRARLGAVGAGSSDNAPLQGPPRPIPNLTIASPLAKGKMEGWVKARFMGSTEWKKCWLVLTKDKPEEASGAKKFWQKLGGAGDRSSILSLGGGNKDKDKQQPDGASPGTPGNNLTKTTSISGFADMEPPPGNNGATGVAQFFANKKDKKPMSTLVYAAHTFAVYPSRPELVEGSSLFKVEGAFPQSQVLSATNRIRQTGWVMIMPELEAGSKGANAEMMKWVVAFMDAFHLYGRPEGFNWDARNPVSSFFAYPIGQFKDRLFLDRELAEFLDVREERHLASRSNLHGIMSARMRGERTPILPPLPTPNTKHTQQLNGKANGASGATTPNVNEDSSETPKATPAIGESKTLPPLDFGEQPPAQAQEQQQQTNGNHTGNSLAAHQPNGALDTIGERSREGSTLTIASPTGGARGEASQVPHAPSASSKPALSVDPNYQRSDRGSHHSGAGPQGGVAPAAALAGAAAGAGGVAAYNEYSARPREDPPAHHRPSTETGSGVNSVYRQGSLASQRQRPESSRGSGALSPPSQGRDDYQGASSMHAKSPSPVPSHVTTTQYGNATDTESVRSGRQQGVPAPSIASDRDRGVARASSVRDQQQPRQPHILAPSGRGAEADPAFQQHQQSHSSPVDQRRSDADFSSNYDEGALFYLRSMSDQLPAPIAKPVQQQREIAQPVEQQPVSAVAKDSPIGVDTPSAYTQPSYAASPADEFSRNPSLRRPTATVPGAASSLRQQQQPAPVPEDADRFDEDALAAYSYLDQPPSPSALARGKSLTRDDSAPAARSVPAGVVAAPSPVAPLSSQSATPPTPTSYPSTFGQNKRAQDRKEAAQAQAAAHAAALSKPGKAAAGGRKKSKKQGLKARGKHAWGEESSEDDEDEEEEEEDDEEEEAQARARAARGRLSQQQLQQQQQPIVAAQQPAPFPNGSAMSEQERAAQTAAAAGLPPPGMARSHSRPSLRGSGSMDGSGSPSGRSSPAGASRSISPATMQQQQQQQQYQHRAGGNHPALMNQRQSMFNSHLAAPHGEEDARSISPGSQGGYGGYNQSPYQASQGQTFVQLNANEQPGSMTAVFQPHGLLQAGAQDKAERSAKQQELEARQAGVGMVNVPNKPPPPQAGLLGAISAHERDRKGAGGLGATLTERERQRVEAERRQREEDARMSGGMNNNMGGMNMGMPNGGAGWPQFNPYMWQQMMMMNPMMMGMGMNPMGMGGGGSQVGHGGGGGGGSSPPPGGMPGMDPYMQQQMAAAMMAQQAYMQAMSQQGGNAPSMMSGMGGGAGEGQQRPMSMSPNMPSMPSMGMHPMSMYGGMGGMGGMGMYGMPQQQYGSEFGGGMGGNAGSPRQQQRRMDNSSGGYGEQQQQQQQQQPRNESPLKR